MHRVHLEMNSNWPLFRNGCEKLYKEENHKFITKIDQKISFVFFFFLFVYCFWIIIQAVSLFLFRTSNPIIVVSQTVRFVHLSNNTLIFCFFHWWFNITEIHHTLWHSAVGLNSKRKSLFCSFFFCLFISIYFIIFFLFLLLFFWVAIYES